MSSRAKMLDLLTLFSPEKPVWTVEEIIEKFGYSRPIAYRYIGALGDAGLLNRIDGGYALGFGIIELDYIIRQSDPLLISAQGVMRGLAERYGCEVVLLSLFGDTMVTVHEERGPGSPAVGFGRGRPYPRFRGAGSNVILAFLPPSKQKKLFTKYRDEAAVSSLGGDWETFRAELKKIRAVGYATSVGELEMGNVGIAAPIFDTSNRVIACVGLVMDQNRYEISDKMLLHKTLLSAAKRVTKSVAEMNEGDQEILPKMKK